jgi:hypothetical protein
MCCELSELCHAALLDQYFPIDNLHRCLSLPTEAQKKTSEAEKIVVSSLDDVEMIS